MALSLGHEKASCIKATRVFPVNSQCKGPEADIYLYFQGCQEAIGRSEAGERCVLISFSKDHVGAE